jgi:hypothetical protein
MLDFDHVAFWRDQLPRLFLYLDLQRYGRMLHNRISHARRQHPTQLKNGRVFRYDCDRAMGGAAFRFHSLHEDENDRSLQRFVQQTGRRGQRYLQKMDRDRLGPLHYIG